MGTPDIGNPEYFRPSSPDLTLDPKLFIMQILAIFSLAALLSCATSTIAWLPPSPARNVYFLLDIASDHLGYFKLQQNIFEGLFNQLRNIISGTRVGVITFDENVQQLIKLDSNLKLADITTTKVTVRNLGNVFIEINIRDLFSPSEGGLPNASNVIVVFIRGRISDNANAIAAANRLRAKPIRIIYVVIGTDVDLTLAGLASSTDIVLATDVVEVDGYVQLVLNKL
uniref:Matrilin-like protein n=1 Tax=Arion lusitanicus TaxID=236853 RepID=I3VFQ7_9EUPU|nr:matrilin-like protein [Arion lusitanicus]